MRVKDKIQLRTPNGVTIDTQVAGIAHAKTEAGSQYPIQLPPEISEDNVPPGTEIWLI